MITPERIEEINQELRETAAADSLKSATKTKPTTDAEVDALSVAMKLNTDQKQRHIDYLQKSLSADGNDAWKKADGDAKRNRDSLLPKGGTTSAGDVKLQKKKKLKKEIDDKLGKEFSEEFREQAVDLFVEAVERNSCEALFELVSQLLNNDPSLSLAFADDATLDICQAYSERIEELEDLCEAAEFERDMLMREAQSLSEEALIYVVPKRRRSSHNIAEDLESVDPDSMLMGETSHEHMDPAMRKRISYLEQAARNEVSPAQHLVETWKITS
jgi:hypothetical protein